MSWIRGADLLSSGLRLVVCAVALWALAVTLGVSTTSSAAAAGSPPALPHTWAVPNGGVPVAPAAKSGYLQGAGQVSPLGAFTYDVPLTVPDGRMGMAPGVGLHYSSAGGDGPLGLGWSGTWDSRITRCGKTPRVDGTRGGVRFDADDRYCLDGQRLVGVGGTYGGGDGEYRTEMDMFARVRSINKAGSSATLKTGPDEFEVYGKDGRIRTYRAVETVRSQGSVQLTDESFHEASGNYLSSTHIEQIWDVPVTSVRVWWELVSDRDRTGNEIRYEYQDVGSVAKWGFERVLARIRYTYGPGRDAERRVEFVWQDRDDKSSSFMSGVEFGLTKRLERVEMHAPNPAKPGLVRKYLLSYLPMTGVGARSRSMLAQVQECAERACMPAKQFTWSESSMPSFRTTSLGYLPPANPWPSMPGSMALRVGDFNGDGADDIAVNPGGYMAADRIRLGRRDAVTGKVAPLADDWELTGQGDWPAEGLAQPACPGMSVGDDGAIHFSDCPSENIVTHARELDVDGDGTSEVVIQVRLLPVQAPQKAKTLVLRWDAGAHRFVDTGLEFPVGYINDWQDFIDVDGDGQLDRVFSRPVPPPSPAAQERMSDRKVSVQLNQDGQFAPPVDSDVDGTCAHMASDVDGDGRGDLLLEKAWERYPGAVLECGMGHGTDALLVNDAGEITVSHGGQNHDPFVKGKGWSYPFLTPQRFARMNGHGTYLENDLGQYRSFRGDFNGDGLQDVLAIGRDLPWDHQARFPAGPFILWNTGTGLVYDRHAPKPAIEFDDLAELRIGDFNGDGRDDVASFYSTGLRWITEPGHPVDLGQEPGAVERISLYISDGRGTFRTTTMDSSAGVTQSDGSEHEWARPLTQLGDFNGDGLLDIVKKDDELRVMLQEATVPDRIIEVHDESSKLPLQQIVYSHDWTDQPHKIVASTPGVLCGGRLACLRRGMPVVREVKSWANEFTSNSFTSPTSVYYSYGDPVADTQNGMIGFGVFREWRPDQPSETITEFDVRVRRGEYFPFAGQPESVRTVIPVTPVTSKDGTATVRVEHTTTHYEFRALNGGANHVVLPQGSSTETWETSATINWNADLTGAASHEHFTLGKKTEPFRETGWVPKYDDYGNLTRSESFVRGGTEDVVVTKFELPANPANPFDPAQQRVKDWLISVPDSQEQLRSEADRSPAPTPAAVIRTTDFTTDKLGRRVAMTTEPGTANAVTQKFGIDDDTGVITSVATATAGMPDRVVHTEYNPSGAFPGQPDEQIYPSQTWTDHTTPEYRPSTWQAVQPAHGVVVATLDLNGVSTATSIDDLGRPVRVVGDGQPKVEYRYGQHADASGFVYGSTLTTTVSTDLTTSGQVNTTTMVADQLGRPRISQITGFDGKPITTTTNYNRLGQLDTEGRPAPDGGTSPGATTYRYDPLGRITHVTSPDNKITTWRFPTPFTTEVEDPRGHKSDSTVDVDGRVVQTRTMFTQNGSPVVAPTKMTYAPFDLIETVKDHHGNVTESTYDVYGRPTKVVDPDRGTTTTTYAGTGELLTRTHLKSKNTSTFKYEDPLGRNTSIIDHDHDTNTDVTTRFEWDSSPHGVGQLASAVSPDGITTTRDYDTLGRPAAQTITDNATNLVYRVGTSYDAIGRPRLLTYPNPGDEPTPFAIRTEYNPHGHLNALIDHRQTSKPLPGKPRPPSSRDLLNITARNADLALTNATFGPSTAVDVVQLQRDHDAETGRLGTITVSKGSQTPPLQQIAYTYDDDGAVDTRTQTSAAGTRSEKYHYDDFHRLTGWDLTAGGAQTNTSYRYNTIGNLISIANSTGVTPSQTIRYPTNGVRPHAMTSADNPDGHGPETYHYDDEGRETRITDQNNKTLRTTSYTPFNLPRKVTDKNGHVTTYAYDAFGARVKESGPQGSTFTVPGLFQARTKAGKTTYVYLIDGVGQAVGDGTKRPEIQYVLTDLLGSATAHIDASGVVKQTYYSDPFGANIDVGGIRQATTPGDVDHRFTGHEHDDELRLINMNGRVYDPIKKSFLTPDPVASNHPYSYVNSNPTNYTDPTGFDGVCDRDNASCPDTVPAGPPLNYSPGPISICGGTCDSPPRDAGATGATHSDGTGTVTLDTVHIEGTLPADGGDTGGTSAGGDGEGVRDGDRKSSSDSGTIAGAITAGAVAVGAAVGAAAAAAGEARAAVGSVFGFVAFGEEINLPESVLRNPVGGAESPLDLDFADDDGTSEEDEDEVREVSRNRVIVVGGRTDGNLLMAHGKYVLWKSPEVSHIVTPPGTELRFYVEHGKRLESARGWLAAANAPGAPEAIVVPPGTTIPNYTIKTYPRVFSRAIKFPDGASLGEILRPDMGTVHCVMCRVVRRK